MSQDEDPDVFLSKIYQIKDELTAIGETIITEERLTDKVIEGLIDDYNLNTYKAESDPEFSLTQIETTMRNIYVNRLARGKSATKSVGRESAMFSSPLDSSSRSAKPRIKCFACGKPGHVMRDCRSRKQQNGRKVKWCSLHKTNKHDNSECKNQLNNVSSRGSSGNNHSNNRQGNNRNSETNNNPQHRQNAETFHQVNQAHTAVTTSRTVPLYTNFQQQSNAPAAGLNTETAPQSGVGYSFTPVAGTNMEPTPPSGVGYTFLAGNLTDSPQKHATTSFHMPVDSGASSHFVDPYLLPGIEKELLDFVKLDPPMCILAAGRNLLQGTSKGIIQSLVTDTNGIERSVRLPVVIISRPGETSFLSV